MMMVDPRASRGVVHDGVAKTYDLTSCDVVSFFPADNAVFLLLTGNVSVSTWGASIVSVTCRLVVVTVVVEDGCVVVGREVLMGVVG